MSRIYSRAQAQTETIDVAERARPALVRHSPHTDRDATASRDDGVRTEASSQKWINPSSLDAPTPRPGFVQRWIADGSQSSDNERNWLKKMREGWSPREPSTIPESQRVGFPTARLTSGQDVIRVASLVLCEMPRQVAMQRSNAVNDLIKRQSSSMPQSVEELTRRGGKSFGAVEQHEEETALRGRQAPTIE